MTDEMSSRSVYMTNISLVDIFQAVGTVQIVATSPFSIDCQHMRHKSTEKTTILRLDIPMCFSSIIMYIKVGRVYPKYSGL
jgi:hypothetical protein